MSENFNIVADWISGEYGSPEIRGTSALVTIQLNGHTATRSEDEWSRSVRASVRVSAYPLALWLAASWWRLRWEPSFENVRTDLSWRMAHETSAVGHGFIWPRLVFESDGENVDAMCFASRPAAAEPIRYLENFHVTVSSSSFERGIDEFVSLVIARLEAIGVQESQLQQLWTELRDEQQDSAVIVYRKLEAQLGFDADEAPENLLHELMALAARVGEGAVSEVAPACSGENPVASLQRVRTLAEAQGVEGRLQVPGLIGRVVSSQAFKDNVPWKRGRELAHAARSAWGLGASRLSDHDFGEILGVDEGVLGNAQETLDHLPLGLAVRSGNTDKWKYIFRRRARTGRRFEAARLIADYFVSAKKDLWLPTTDAKTARQKMQRAFAAEFLCPIESLKYWLQGNYSPEVITDAGEYFGVSPLAVRSHLANNGLIHPSEVSQ